MLSLQLKKIQLWVYSTLKTIKLNILPLITVINRKQNYEYNTSTYKSCCLYFTS